MRIDVCIAMYLMDYDKYKFSYYGGPIPRDVARMALRALNKEFPNAETEYATATCRSAITGWDVSTYNPTDRFQDGDDFVEISSSTNCATGQFNGYRMRVSTKLTRLLCGRLLCTGRTDEIAEYLADLASRQPAKETPTLTEEELEAAVAAAKSGSYSERDEALNALDTARRHAFWISVARQHA